MSLLLDPPQWLQLQDLLYEARHVGLTAEAERRLRGVLSRQSPRAFVMPLDELVRFGLFLIGLYSVQHPEAVRAS